jgi:hypothetical protein
MEPARITVSRQDARDVWKTLDLDLAAGQHVRFTVFNVATPGVLALLAFLGAAPYYLTVERQEGKNAKIKRSSKDQKIEKISAGLLASAVQGPV